MNSGAALIKRLFTVVIFLLLMLSSGCSVSPDRPLSCPPGENIHQVIRKWNENSSSRVSLRAYGRCHIEFETEEESFDENFSVKLWATQPDNIYIQGDIFFNPRGIIFGADGGRFWFAIKPEVDTFVSGTLPAIPSPRLPALQMTTLADCLFINKIRNAESWILEKNEKYDILCKLSNENNPLKKIYINRCDHLPGKIEYYDNTGKTSLVVKTGYYKQLETGEYFPGSISVEYPGVDKNKNLIELEFKTIKKDEFTDAQRKALFSPPDTGGYENVYRLIGNELEKLK